MCASGIYSHVAERIPCFFSEIISHLIISDTVLKEAVFHVFFSNFLFYKFLTFLLLLSLTPEFTTFSRDSLVLSYTLDSYLVAVFQSAVD